MILSATQAGIQTGKSTATITRYIKSGRISAVKREGGGYDIEASELFRVLPPVTAETPAISQSATPENVGDTGGIRLEVERLREALRGAAVLDAAKESQIADLRDRLDRAEAARDREAEERRALQARLAPPIEMPAAAAPVVAQRGFWGRLLGR